MFAFDKPLVWVIILLIVLVLFGANKIPEIGKGLGRGIREFKEETKTAMADDKGEKVETVASRQESKPVATVGTSSAVIEPTVRRRVIKHPDGREEVIEETVSQK